MRRFVAAWMMTGALGWLACGKAPAPAPDAGNEDAGPRDAGGAQLPDSPWAPCEPDAGCGPNYTCSQTAATQFNCFPQNPRYCPAPPGTPVPDGGIATSDGGLFKGVVGSCSVVWSRPLIAGIETLVSGGLVRVHDLNNDGIPDVATTRSGLGGLSSLLFVSGGTGADLSTRALPPEWQMPWVSDPGSLMDGLVVAKGLTDGGSVGGGGVSGSGGSPGRGFGLFSPDSASALFALDGPAGADGFAMDVTAALAPDGGVWLAVGSDNDVIAQSGSVQFLAPPAPAPAVSLTPPSDATWQFGNSLAALAGDGGSVLVVGDPSGTNFDGAVHGFDGLTLAHLWEVDGDESAETFGDILVSPGDLNGDGWGDVVVGAHNAGQGVGKVVALDGLTGQVLWQTAGRRPSEAFGSVLARVGDVDGDGVPDVLAAAPGSPVAPVCGQGGRFTLLSGRTGAILLDIEELTPWDWKGAGLGASIAALRVPAPGSLQLVVTAPEAEWSTDVWAGQPSGQMLGLSCTLP